MIPVLLLFGFLAGRWWRSALGVAAVGWPALLLLRGTLGSGLMPLGLEVLGASALAAANTLVGILLHQAALWAVRRLRRSSAG